MKKVIFTLVAIMATTMVSMAQMPEGPKNVFGIRAGMNVSNFSGGDLIKFDPKVDFNGGVIDQIRLSKKLPFYFETGLMYSGKGAKMSSILGSESATINVGYLEIPIAINFRWAIKKFTIEPQLGFYYGYALFANSKVGGETVNLFEGDSGFKRSDFGMKFGIGASYGKFFLGLGYDLGLMGLSKSGGAFNPKNGNFRVTLGLNFTSKK